MFIAEWPIYKRLSRLRSETFAKYLSPLIGHQANVLDFGCGNMFTALKLKELLPAIQITGVDVIKDQNLDDNMLLKNGVRFLQSSSRELPFEDGILDTTLALAVLHHTVEPEYYVKELIRVTKPGGNLIIVEEMYVHLVDKWYISAQDWFLNKLKEGVPVPLNFRSNNHYESLFKSLNLTVCFKGSVRPFPTYMHHYVYSLKVG